MINVRKKTAKKVSNYGRVPKYRKLALKIINDIEEGKFLFDQKLPSIIEYHDETGLSKDTIVKTLTFLKERKIVTAVANKGFYITRNLNSNKSKVLFVPNKLSVYKLKTYQCFVEALGLNYQVDLIVHHGNPDYLMEILLESELVYDHIVVMPHFYGESKNQVDLIEYMKSLSLQKLLLMDKYIPKLSKVFPSIYQDFENDIITALKEGWNKLKRYSKLTLVFPAQQVYPYPEEIKTGFLRFCKLYSCKYQIVIGLSELIDFKQKDAFIIIDENDLICFLQRVKENGQRLGKDVGVISYNDTPIKELLGISVITTDFEVMADTAAYMIKKKKHESVLNYCSLKDRGSI